ncbi:hypothetical protein AMECASPLE_011347 [Ameca splendens]|uniref:Uncharacterized protein n=1 Tax=Ameca splendens TaxID=208324 RepID=A0ABV0XDU5_9TELE
MLSPAYLFDKRNTFARLHPDDFHSVNKIGVWQCVRSPPRVSRHFFLFSFFSFYAMLIFFPTNYIKQTVFKEAKTITLAVIDINLHKYGRAFPQNECTAFTESSLQFCQDQICPSV